MWWSFSLEWKKKDELNTSFRSHVIKSCHTYIHIYVNVLCSVYNIFNTTTKIIWKCWPNISSILTVQFPYLQNSLFLNFSILVGKYIFKYNWNTDFRIKPSNKRKKQNSAIISSRDMRIKNRTTNGRSFFFTSWIELWKTMVYPSFVEK